MTKNKVSKNKVEKDRKMIERAFEKSTPTRVMLKEMEEEAKSSSQKEIDELSNTISKLNIDKRDFEIAIDKAIIDIQELKKQLSSKDEDIDTMKLQLLSKFKPNGCFSDEQLFQELIDACYNKIISEAKQTERERILKIIDECTKSHVKGCHSGWYYIRNKLKSQIKKEGNHEK